MNKIEETIDTLQKYPLITDENISIRETDLNVDSISEIYVDGCCNKKVGSCGSVICFANGKRIDLLHHFEYLFTDLKIETVNVPIGNIKIIKVNFPGLQQQNNGAELLAMVAGLKIALQMKNVKRILSDSQLIVDYWSKNMSKTITDVNKRFYINECIKLRKLFEERGGEIIKISGDDNLADLGFHKK